LWRVKTYALGSAADDAREVRCTGARRHHERLLLAFEGVATPEEARTIVGSELYAERSEPELASDEYLDRRSRRLTADRR
jgi:ribosomal 30S subunit maturation factor RimM